MKRLYAVAVVVAILTMAAFAPPSAGAESDNCAEFNQLVSKTYNFDESRLSNKQKMAKEKDLDRFWKTIKARKKEFLPCLRSAIQNTKSNPFFRYDGSNLLVEIDPSTASKSLQVDIFTATDVDMVGAERWVSVLAYRGTEGFDISRAAERWLRDSKAHYIIPEHGGFEVGKFEGALFLFGSMNETQATPALLKIIAQAKHPGRESALNILMSQATPEALQALKKVDTSPFSADAQQTLKDFLSANQFIEPRPKPKISRAEFLQAFQEFVKGDGKRFSALVDKAEDGERDAVVVLKPEDLPLVRKVRRLMIAGGNQHAISYYYDFTSIILQVMLKSEPDQQRKEPTTS